VENAIVDDFLEETKVAKAVLHLTKALHGRGLDYLINNAGVQPFGSGLSDIRSEQFSDVLRMNVVSVHIFTAATMELLRQGSSKTVVNMEVRNLFPVATYLFLLIVLPRSSVMGSITYTNRFVNAPAYAYKVSKAALNMLTSRYALEYGHEGFTFLVLSSGVSVSFSAMLQLIC
jgi:NAD(P)-dependent dehydrogenase (short-subunit alcohol dehydrogenase family)